MAITQRRRTLHEFLKLPERKPALEFEGGVVVQKVWPKGKHGRLQSKLAELIDRFAEPRKLAMAFTETRATYANSSVVPDIAVYAWDRIPDREDEVANDFLVPPDIAVEVVSPKQSVMALVRKCQRFVERGSRLALLVDPEDRSVLLFQPGGRARALRGPDRINLDAVLPGFELTVQQLFDTLRVE